MQRVQALQPGDGQAREEFCRWILRRVSDNPDFLINVLWTDEATFTRHGVINTRNLHHWSLENPRTIRQSRFQVEFSINVWAGIVGDHLIGPYELPGRLNSERYLEFLQTTLPTLLEDVPFNIRAAMWFQHDGAPPHFGRQVRSWLNQRYRDRLIGRGGPVSWPPRSPDLNPLDFYLWGHMKGLVYATEVTTRDELLDRIHEAAAAIHHTPEQLGRVRSSLLRRAETCLRVQGAHIEHLL